MLLEIDRLQIATEAMDECIKRWHSLLGAEVHSVDRVNHLAARRTRLRLGVGYVEVLEPDGAGVVADSISKRGSHLFAAGAATQDRVAIKQQLAKATNRSAADFIVEHDSQLYLDGADIGIPGLRMVISEYQQLPSVGEIDYLYEATLLAADAQQKTAQFAEVFNLDAQKFVEIDSPRFGYNGLLTLFREARLHRFEVISPLEASNTMGRFFNKVGACLYMGFAETSNILAIEQKVLEQGLGVTVDRPTDRAEKLPADQVWLHPSTLGGVMLGLSRPSMAWRWSGSPEKVMPVEADLGGA